MSAKFDDFGFGFSWMLEESAHRTCHALAAGGRVWLIDPVDTPEAIERARGLGELAAVVQLLDRHNRDCAALAARLGVPHLRLPETLPDAPLTTFRVVWSPGWRELGLWWTERRVLVVTEAIGTLPLFTTGDKPAGVHPILRFFPPRVLRGYQPEHLLVGHGLGVHGPEAASALEQALARSRADVPRLLMRLPSLLKR